MIFELSELQSHPFNLIGLADREKFHTGMLAFTLRSFLEHDEELFFDLVSELWNQRFEKCSIDKIHVEVEHSGIDLVIATDGVVTHWAEMKLKTGLSDQQIRRYEDKYPNSASVLLGLFPEQTGSKKTVYRSFPTLVSRHITGLPNDRLRNSGLSEDRLVLISMWVKYLSGLARLSDTFVVAGLEEIPDANKVSSLLRRIKLRGIFERYRYNLIQEQMSNPQSPVQPQLFNSNGNAGLDIRIEASLPYGLQWQAGALKLFVEDPDFKKGNATPERDSRLVELAANFCDHFDLERNTRLNASGKFRSITVRRWGILENCHERGKFLTDGLDYLSGLNV